MGKTISAGRPLILVGYTDLHVKIPDEVMAKIRKRAAKAKVSSRVIIGDLLRAALDYDGDETKVTTK